MTSAALAEVASRVAQLASLVAPPPPAATGATTTSTTGTTGGADFAAALADVLGSSAAAGRTTTSAVATTTAAAATGRTGGAGAGFAAPAGVTGQDLVDAARGYIGVPYVWGGESLAEGGLDCSGLVQRSLADLGVTGVPRVARDQATLGTPVASLADARPGDLVVFDGGKHIGIYVGDGQMIDAPRPGKTVQQRDVYETPTAIRRILPSAGTAATADPGASAALTVSTVTDDVAAQQALVAALLAGAAA